MQTVDSFRPRGGATYTLGVDEEATFTIPGNAHTAVITAKADYGRVVMTDSDTAPAATATSYGYLRADSPMTVKLVQGRDRYIHLSSTVADNVITVTYGN